MFRPCGERVCNFKIQKSSLCSNWLRIFNFDNINHSCNPPLLKREVGRTLQKFFYYFTVQFNHAYIFGSSVFWFSHARFSSTFSSKSCTKTWYYLYISDTFWSSLQKMLTALSNLVWNTQKSKWANFFLSTKTKCFLVLKRFYKR